MIEINEINALQRVKSTGSPVTAPIQPVVRVGFTLTEVLVVISVIGILLAITFPALQVARNAARRSLCGSNIRQVMLATLSYESTGVGFPPAANKNGGNFIISLLPFLEEQQLHDEAKRSFAPGETYEDRYAEISDTLVAPLLCPAAFTNDREATIASQGFFTGHYYGIAGAVGESLLPGSPKKTIYDTYGATLAGGAIGLNGIFSPQKSGEFKGHVMRDVRDGVSVTFAFGEIALVNTVNDTDPTYRNGWAFGAKYDSSQQVAETYGVKTIGTGINSDADKINHLPFGSNHPTGAHFAAIDGSVHFVDERISVDILKAFASINKEEKAASLEDY